MPTRFFSPPDTPRTVLEPSRTCAHFCRPSIAITSSTRAACSAGPASPPRRSRAMHMSTSRTVSVEMQSKCSSFETSVTTWRRLVFAGVPSYVIAPLITPSARCDEQSWRSVGIHGPARPMTYRVSPGFTTKLTSCSTGVSAPVLGARVA